MKLAVITIAMLALILPPASVTARPVMVNICGEAGLRIMLPAKLPLPGQGDDDRCCKKGCHAANDRKKRVAGQAGDADEDDNCC